MVYPVGGYIDKVYVIAFAHLFPDIFTAVVGGCFGHVGATQHVLAAVHSELVQVAQSLYLDSFLIGEAADGFGTPGAQTDKSDAHGFVGSQVSPTTSVCPAGRGGVETLICVSALFESEVQAEKWKRPPSNRGYQ